MDDEMEINDKYCDLIDKLTNKQFMKFISRYIDKDDIIEEFSKIGMFLDKSKTEKLDDIEFMTQFIDNGERNER